MTNIGEVLNAINFLYEITNTLKITRDEHAAVLRAFDILKKFVEEYQKANSENK